jgi:NAD(P)-dependent dehydrogenase (short-subunit alcohol dehydrogenase family)
MAEATAHSAELFRTIMETNVAGVAAYGTIALRYMQSQGSGAIVNVTSGAYLGLPSMAAYAASKGAVVSLTYAWATDFEGSAVRINALSPRAATAMTEVLWDFRGDPADTRKSQRAAMPTPEANAAAVIYLLSDQAAGLSGQVVRADGDRISLISHPEVLSAAHARAGLWTVEELAAAFTVDGRLVKDVQPIGIVERQELSSR